MIHHLTNLPLACSVCFGETDSLAVKGLGYGIIVLLVVLISVLVSFGIFFLKLRKRLIKFQET